MLQKFRRIVKYVSYRSYGKLAIFLFLTLNKLCIEFDSYSDRDASILKVQMSKSWFNNFIYQKTKLKIELGCGIVTFVWSDIIRLREILEIIIYNFDIFHPKTFLQIRIAYLIILFF